jgi:hypothetical protein
MVGKYSASPRNRYAEPARGPEGPPRHREPPPAPRSLPVLLSQRRASCAHDIETLRGQLDALITALHPPSPLTQNDAKKIVAFLHALKQSERRVNPTELKSLALRLTVFLKNFCETLDQTRQAASPLPFDLEDIRIIFLGLTKCAPVGPFRGLFAGLDNRTDFRKSLQGITHTLLTHAMDNAGWTEDAEGGGRIIDMVNWLSRGLKFGLLRTSDPICLAYQHALILFDNWFGGDQTQGCLDMRQRGKCAVQLDMMLTAKFKLIDLAAQSLSGKTYEDHMINCVINLCAQRVRYLINPATDTIPLVNIYNLLLSIIERDLLRPDNAEFVSAVDYLIGQVKYISSTFMFEGTCHTAATVCDFLCAADEILTQTNSAATDSHITEASQYMLNRINSEAFAQARPSAQHISDLISFVGRCHKRDASAAVLSAAILMDRLLECSAKSFVSPQSIATLLTGLDCFLQLRLAVNSPRLQAFILALMDKIVHSQSNWAQKSKQAALLALDSLLNNRVLTLNVMRTALLHILKLSSAVSDTQLLAELAKLTADPGRGTETQTTSSTAPEPQINLAPRSWSQVAQSSSIPKKSTS